MLPDAPPRTHRAEFSESDRIKTLDLPRNGALREIAQRLESATKDKIRYVRSASTEFLATASDFYEVPTCGVRVLARRCQHTPDSMLIRVWMRTAVRKEVTSFGTFLSTLCHEFCHHLDFKKFGFADSWHTRGFYERAGVLYRYAKGTPLKTLFWVRMAGGRWRIDWQRTNRGA